MGVDPVSIAALAVAIGAQEAVKTGVAEAVKDAYAALKRFISERYKGVDPSPVEKKPDSDSKRGSLAEDLKEAGADSDSDLLALAEAVIKAVRAENPQAGEPIGVNLEEIEAEALRIHNVWSTGGGVNVKGARVSGPIDISDVTSGQKGSTTP
jgi:type II secretory pathway pseudopilin PulG